MVVPTMGCQASCSYCFGPREGGAAMGLETVLEVVRWQRALDPDEPIEITFHGGEPLLAGVSYFRSALPALRGELGRRRVRLGVQSNLWLLDDELCELFREHGVTLGSSVDGPESTCDAQRGKGYFRRTMDGIERARRHGLAVGCICTFTPALASRADEVFDFFYREGLDFTVHAAVRSLRSSSDGHHLGSEELGQLLLRVLDRYLARLDRIRVGTLDAMCRSVSAGQGGICTFTDCLGGYLAVGPDGAIYPCQRFVGLTEYAMGSVHHQPTQADMAATPVWQAFRAREERVAESCGGCPAFAICRGGCPYNVLAARGSLEADLRDPHCDAYRHVFAELRSRAVAEVLAPENLDEVVARPSPEQGLLRRGRLISLMRKGAHPVDAARAARAVLAAVAVAANTDESAAHKLAALGVLADAPRAASSLGALRARLLQPHSALNNLYLHVTFACDLACRHCYAEAGAARHGAMAVGSVLGACRQASSLGFRHAVITGGEPLVHPEREALLAGLAEHRGALKPLHTVLRTNLAGRLSRDLLSLVARATDEVVVSLDGDAASHDARRGAGTYAATVANLRALLDLGPTSEVSLAAVLPVAAIQGPEGEAVRSLARELGLRRTRFKPLLPLGRALAALPDIVPEAAWGHLDPHDAVGYGFHPAASCGLGQNLYVEPDGGAFPCYAWHGETWRLGSIDGDGGLATVVGSARFLALAGHTVDSNRRCRVCPLRYLCGGSCRAWNRHAPEAQLDLDAPPVDCSHLHRRARAVLDAALAHLGIQRAQWSAAGLPLPDEPPAVAAAGGEEEGEVR